MPTAAQDQWLGKLGVNTLPAKSDPKSGAGTPLEAGANTASAPTSSAAPTAAPAASATPSKPPAPTPSAAASGTEEIGSLSAHWESGSKGSNAIGDDTTGGWSYGKFQIETKGGTMKAFLDYVKTADKEVYDKLDKAGGAKGATDHTDDFTKAWTDLATDGKLTSLEHGFIEEKNYKPQEGKLSDKGIKLEDRSKALKDVVWSTAVQHGAKADVMTTAVDRLVKQKKDAEAKTKKPDDKSPSKTDKEIAAALTDEEIINEIYDERGRFQQDAQAKDKLVDGKKVLKYFSGSTQKVQDEQVTRFEAERKAALAELKDAAKQAPALAAPTPASPPSPAATTSTATATPAPAPAKPEAPPSAP